MPPLRCYVTLGLVLAQLAACGTAVNVADYALSRSTVEGATGVSGFDLEDLRSGRIDQVRARYSSRDPSSLSQQQLALFCDILAKYRDFGRATACLDAYETRFGRSPAVAGKRALIALALGDPGAAASFTAPGDDSGSRYVHALAEARLGQTGAARAAADQFARRFEPKTVFYAASLYSAVGDNEAAWRTLDDPEHRLLRDYGVTRNATLFGKGQQAPFRLDVFDEFSFGLLGDFSYAPAGNVYVEYLAAHSLLELGRLQEALPHLDELLAYPGLSAYRDVEWLVLYDRGRVSRRLDRLDEARDFFERSIADIESMRRSVSSDEGRIGFAAQKQDVYAALVDVLRETGRAEAAFDYAERARGRALVDLLASRNSLAPREIPSGEASELLGTLQTAEGQEELAAAAPASTPALRASASSADIRQRIARRAPSLAPLISVSPASLADIRGTLAPDETAIAYFRSGSGWIAFVITRGALSVVLLPGASDIDRMVLSFLRSVVASGGGGQAYQAEGRALYDALIRPVEATMGAGLQRLVLVPYGKLHYVPFAALHDGSAHLIEKYPLRQVPSLSASVAAEKTRTAGSGSLVIGNPTRRGGAPPLPSAEQEAAQVGRLLPGATVLVESEATLGHFRTLAPGKAYIHIAGHGEFNPLAPLRSRLLLAPDAGNNGDLTVESLYTLRLDARLVTLSACRTAVSTPSDGDDLVGLVRGFLFAGASNVVATLWDVSDVTTGELVSAFYTALAGTHSVPDALRRAQLDMMRRHPEPFHWAAFMPISFSPRL